MREGCLRAEGCLATAWLPIIGRALEVLCLRVRAWTCLDGVRRAALCAMPDRGLVSFPNLLVTKTHTCLNWSMDGSSHTPGRTRTAESAFVPPRRLL